MSATVDLIRKQIIGRELEFVATVISNPELINFDKSTGGAPVWVVDLEIGGNRPVRKVPIKASGSGARFYAQLGQTVKVRRSALGRMYVIGPGDTTIAVKQTLNYSLVTGNLVTTVNEGFSLETLPFEFYMGPQSMKGNPVVNFTTGPNEIVRDAGSWLTDGFTAAGGDSIEVQNSVSNDTLGTPLTTTSATALVLAVSDTLVTETGAQPVYVLVKGTSLWNDGVTPFNFSRTIDGDGNPV